MLEQLGLSRDGAVIVPPCSYVLDGRVLLNIAADLGLEGVVCKRAESTYQAGRRSLAWVKTPSVGVSFRCAVISAVQGPYRGARRVSCTRSSEEMS